MKRVESYLRGYTKTVPLAYAEFCYRREMGYTQDELDSMPAYIVEQDFAFLGAEAKQAERDKSK